MFTFAYALGRGRVREGRVGGCGGEVREGGREGGGGS